MKDDLRATYERNKEKRADTAVSKKAQMGFKDWIVITTSTLAFAMSTLTTYLNSLRTVDDVRLVVAKHPKMLHPKGADFVIVDAEHEFTFSNAGNRSVAITSASLFLRRNFPGGGASETVSCDRGGGGGTASSVAYDLAPLVLKPQEIAIKAVALKPQSPVSSDAPKISGASLSLMNMSTPVDFEIDTHFCVRISVVTPDETYQVVKELFHVPITTNGEVRFNISREGENRQSLFDQMTLSQWILVKETRSIFSLAHRAE